MIPHLLVSALLSQRQASTGMFFCFRLCQGADTFLLVDGQSRHSSVSEDEHINPPRYLEVSCMISHLLFAC